MAKLTRDNMEFEIVRTRRGPCVVLAFVNGHVEPVGHVYGVFHGQRGAYRFEVLASYVHEGWRRRGVRTMLHHYLTRECGCVSVTTDYATGDGEAWMLSAGYTRPNGCGQWVWSKNHE